MRSFWDYAEDYPPILCRLLARHRNGPPLTTGEIAERSGLSGYTVNSISQSLSWDLIPFDQMKAFLIVCDMDFTDPVEMNRKAVYLKTKHKFRYLTRSPEWETILRPLVDRYREHISKELK